MSRKVLQRAAKRQITHGNYQESPDNLSDSDNNYSPQPDLLALLVSLKRTRRRSVSRRNSTKRRKTTNCTCPNHSQSTSATPRKSKESVTKKRNSAKATKNAVVSTISLDSDEEKVEVGDSHLKNIENKIDSFFKSNNLISDDEDEDIKSKVNDDPKKTQDFYTLPSDSDDECKVINIAEKSYSSPSNADCLPSSSGVKENVSTSQNGDDLMEIIDEVLESNKDYIPETSTPEISIEEYKKKTEEMLGSLSTLIDDFKKKDDNQKEIVNEQKTPVKVIPSCPICLESLADRETAATFCGHIFCDPCIKRVAKTTKKCPTCRKAVNLKKIHPVYL